MKVLMMNVAGSIVAWSLVFSWATAAVSADEPVFRWQREVELPPIATTAVVAIELDEHFHSRTRLNWPDFRLRDEQGHNIGCLLDTAKVTEMEASRESWPAKSLKAHVSGERGLQVEFTLDKKDPLPDALSIVTPLRDFEQQVRVESSADGVSWTAAGEPTLIFDYTQFIDARNIEVPVNGGEHRHFRLTIADITAEQETQLLELNRRLRGGEETDRTERTTIERRPFRVDQLMLSRQVKSVRQKKNRLRIYPATRFTVDQNEKNKQTIVQFAIDSQPVGSVRLLVTDLNFHRRARFEWEQIPQHSTDTPGWSGIDGTLIRFNIGTIHREIMVLDGPNGQFGSLAPPKINRYRVIIENGDSPPLNITGVEPLGKIAELQFLATPGQKLHLEYGSPDAAAAQTDVAALQEALRQDLPVQFGKLGEPRENLSAPVVPAWKPWNDPRVLVGGIVLLTLIMGYGLYCASSRITMPPEGP